MNMIASIAKFLKFLSVFTVVFHSICFWYDLDHLLTCKKEGPKLLTLQSDQESEVLKVDKKSVFYWTLNVFAPYFLAYLIVSFLLIRKLEEMTKTKPKDQETINKNS